MFGPYRASHIVNDNGTCGSLFTQALSRSGATVEAGVLPWQERSSAQPLSSAGA